MIINRIKQCKCILAVCVLSVAFISCATKPPVKSVDTSPKSPTNVLTAKYVISGFILPDSKGDQIAYTRENHRRIQESVTYDSWISRKIFGNGKNAIIADVNKNTSWMLDLKNKTYTECPLAGCKNDFLAQYQEQIAQSGGEEEYDDAPELFSPEGTQACSIKLGENSFGVSDAIAARTINGFDAKQYQATWTMIGKDHLGREDKHRLIMDFWMTEPTADMKDGWAINEAFHKNMLVKVQQENNPLARYFGSDIYKALAMFSGDTAKTANPTSSQAVNQLSNIQGYPVSIKMQWTLDSKACPELAKQPSSNESYDNVDTSSVSSFVGGLASNFLKKKAEKTVKKVFDRNANDPLFTYIYDVTSSAIKDEHDSIFTVPSDFKLQDRQ